jgi:hypothetical protein
METRCFSDKNWSFKFYLDELRLQRVNYSLLSMFSTLYFSIHVAQRCASEGPLESQNVNVCCLRYKEFPFNSFRHLWMDFWYMSHPTGCKWKRSGKLMIWLSKEEDEKREVFYFSARYLRIHTLFPGSSAFRPTFEEVSLCHYSCTC